MSPSIERSCESLVEKLADDVTVEGQARQSFDIWK